MKGVQFIVGSDGESLVCIGGLHVEHEVDGDYKTPYVDHYKLLGECDGQCEKLIDVNEFDPSAVVWPDEVIDLLRYLKGRDKGMRVIIPREKDEE